MKTFDMPHGYKIAYSPRGFKDGLFGSARPFRVLDPEGYPLRVVNRVREFSSFGVACNALWEEWRRKGLL